jgi:response regulator RpfG family c-di-GMP phosphodiesterase
MTESTGRPRILCVDDEPHVLDALVDILRRPYEVTTATSGLEGIAAIEHKGPFAAVVSDMRMPGMDGAAFLARARRLAPDTTRMLLTGQADIEAAAAVVNDGGIFRFLLKPCSPEALLEAVAAAVEQRRLVTAERELLQDTLRGCLEAMTDVLSLANPTLFGRAQRLRRLARAVADARGLADPWFVEIAAMLSQLGAVTLTDDTAEKLCHGGKLDADEELLVRRLPDVAIRLLQDVPRIEPVIQIIQNASQDADQKAIDGSALSLGAKILRLVADYDELDVQGVDAEDAFALMRGRGVYDPILLEKLALLRGATAGNVVVEVSLGALEPGMVFFTDVYTPTGAKLIPRGYVATPQLLERLENLRSAEWAITVQVKVDPEMFKTLRAA